MGDGGELEKLPGRRLLALEPVVHHALELPGGLAELGKADHAAAAFQRVEAAADAGEHLQISRLGAAFH